MNCVLQLFGERIELLFQLSVLSPSVYVFVLILAELRNQGSLCRGQTKHKYVR